MIGKGLKVGPSESWGDKMASGWPQDNPSNRPLYFIKQSVTQDLPSFPVVVANRRIDVLLKVPVVDDVHGLFRRVFRMSSQVQDEAGSVDRKSVV